MISDDWQLTHCWDGGKYALKKTTNGSGRDRKQSLWSLFSPDLSSSDWQPAITIAALLEKFLQLLMWGATMSNARECASTSAFSTERWVHAYVDPRGPAGLAVQPLDWHLVNVGSIPTGPTYGEGRRQPHPGDVLKSTPNVRKSPRSGLNLEGRLSDPQF